MSSLAPDILPLTDAQTVSSSRGTVRIWHPAPTVFVNRIEGTLNLQAARAINAASQRVVASDGRLIVFQDWEEMTGYDRDARQELTRVGVEFRKFVDGSYFLLRSRILILAVQVGNILLGNLKVMRTRAEMDQLLRETVHERRSGGSRAAV